ncbi:DUF4190 domain-containing protein [Nocardiopsis sp. RSe5-2]|uniref:DUF4190 domain-containing protein n=1 Tax=Nocardiopsis endophytica TaxID=3018445 RepID=A0ABT4UBG0_9ACTN|nr:DUF4190 domain-containing protein [Nocardiopsis endophytica]MDA2814288.1 DUF4190 domain-containing protein [Nocardiopsis endophytica]
MTDQSPQPHADGQPPTVEKGGLWGVFLSAAGLMLPPFGVLLSLLGIHQGRKARRAARENSGHAPGAVLSMVLGWIGVLFSAAAIAGYIVFWDEYTAYQECSARALTVSTQEQCDAAWRSAVSERAGIPEDEVPSLGGSA